MNTEETTQSGTSQEKHTPGPWTVERSDFSDATILNIKCTVYPWKVASSETVRGADSTSAIANAYLIAAAPDLLAAAKLVAEQLKSECEFSSHIAFLHQELLTVINKAEGRSL